MLFVIGVVMVVPYTEIDWEAYMSEVKGFLDGELTYENLKGGTGPLVYPGGFVWLYSALYYITKLGVDIQCAQWIFIGVYLALLGIVLSFYTRVRTHFRVLIPLFLSKRIRSLFVLRLFNDCWAMLFLYAAIAVMAHHRRWKLGCLLYSMAVSIKMNIFLFAPGLFYVLVRALPATQVVVCLGICALWQLFAGYPFLLHDPVSYLKRAFELGRVFTYRWSVNFQCVPEAVFLSPEFGLGLLMATLGCWVLVWRTRWARRRYAAASGTLKVSTKKGQQLQQQEVDSNEDDDEVFKAIVLTMLESNLIGVAFSRSMHYQFLTWFYHSMPFVLYFTKLPSFGLIIACSMVRYSFDTYPPTSLSSTVLLASLGLSVVAVIFLGNDRSPAATSTPQSKKTGASPSSPAPAKAVPVKASPKPSPPPPEASEPSRPSDGANSPRPAAAAAPPVAREAAKTQPKAKAVKNPNAIPPASVAPKANAKAAQPAPAAQASGKAKKKQ